MWLNTTPIYTQKLKNRFIFNKYGSEVFFKILRIINLGLEIFLITTFARCKNIKRTEQLVYLKEAILRIATFFQVNYAFFCLFVLKTQKISKHALSRSYWIYLNFVVNYKRKRNSCFLLGILSFLFLCEKHRKFQKNIRHI